MAKKNGIKKRFREAVATGLLLLAPVPFVGCATPTYENPIVNRTVDRQPEGDLYYLVRGVQNGRFALYTLDSEEKGKYLFFDDLTDVEKNISFPEGTKRIYDVSDKKLGSIIDSYFPVEDLQVHTTYPDSTFDRVPVWVEKSMDSGKGYDLKAKRLEDKGLLLYFDKKVIRDPFMRGNGSEGGRGSSGSSSGGGSSGGGVGGGRGGSGRGS